MGICPVSLQEDERILYFAASIAVSKIYLELTETFPIKIILMRKGSENVFQCKFAGKGKQKVVRWRRV